MRSGTLLTREAVQFLVGGSGRSRGQEGLQLPVVAHSNEKKEERERKRREEEEEEENVRRKGRRRKKKRKEKR